MGTTKSVKNGVRKGMYSWEINVHIHDKCMYISLHDVTGDTKRGMDIIFVMHSRRQQSWRYGPACWACGATMSCDIVHKKRTGPMHIKAEHRYSYLTRTNEYYGSETHSSTSCTQYDVGTYPYTSRYGPHKKREGSPFCNNAYTTTAVMEVLTCLLSMCYLLLCHRTQKSNWTRAHKS